MNKDFEFRKIKAVLQSDFSYTTIEDTIYKIAKNYIIGHGTLYTRWDNKYHRCDLYLHHIYDMYSVDDNILLVCTFKVEILNKKSIYLDTTGYWYVTDDFIVFFRCSGVRFDRVITYDKELNIIDTFQKTNIIDIVKDTKNDIIYTYLKEGTGSVSFRHFRKGDLFIVHPTQSYQRIFSTGRFDEDVYFIQYLDRSIYFYTKTGEYINHFAHYPHVLKIEHIKNYVYSIIYLNHVLLILNYKQKLSSIHEQTHDCVYIEYDYEVAPFITKDENYIMYLAKEDSGAFLYCTQLYGNHLSYKRKITEYASYSCIYYEDGTITLTTYNGTIIQYSLCLTELVPE